MAAPDRRTLPYVLAAQADRFGARPFLIDEGGVLSWAEAWTITQSLCAGFTRLGVRKGDLVVLDLENRRELLLSWFGLATLGAAEVPVNPALRGNELARIVNHSGARLAVVSSNGRAAFEEVADQLAEPPTLVVVDDVPRGRLPTVPFDNIADEPAADLLHEVSSADVVAVMYTSGTTGSPKGVVMPQAQHFENGRQGAAAARITVEDVIFLCLPLHHNMAQGYGIWPALWTGAAVHLVDCFDRHRFWGQVRQSKATVLPFVGGILALLADSPPSDDDRHHGLRVAYGVPVSADLHLAFESRFGVEIIHGYGSTEATIPVWGAGSDRKVGAAGRPIAGFELRIVDELDRPKPSGATGEICVRASTPYTMFQGYYRDPERTVAAFRNLWFHTGDLGMFDTGGHLWFRGRKSEVIRRFGEFVDPAAVEAVIATHPSVSAVAVYGIPSAVTEEEVMVSVVLRPGRQLTAKTVRALVADCLPGFATPRYVEFVDELPTTPTGKIEKYKLRQRGVTVHTDDVRRTRRKPL